jgi:hypothetical protein
MTETLMAAMGVITLCSLYCGWRYAQQAHDAEQEVSRQAGHIEILQNLCADIVALDTPNAAYGVKKAVAIAQAGVAKS